MPENQFELPVVVSGQRLEVDVNVHEILEKVIQKALQKSGNVGQTPSDWELRLNGILLPLTETVGAAGLSEETVVFLSPKTASGG